ncbi:winged helix-turn-helix domain-containing protein [Enterobacter huaxiensis]|uniref:winged helix-turn-helix domain-containing protein n=1 Tax=Enterobacter huaxiensis TaxID=2494702 RepID=UPI0021DB19F8|nr:winged helix-turn-helix domain-containing protein [Enterobacter huaxiensis]
MLFIIEGRVCFRSDDGAFWEQNDEKNKVILSPIVARLLHLLILEKGRVITREEIMNFVWESHGLEPSNNSLNQYISQLRKLMAHFLLPDDCIRTVPREGFILIKEVEINVVNESTPVTQASLIDETSDVILQSKQSGARVLIIFLIFMLIATPYTVIYFTDMMQKQRMSVTPVKIGQVGSCAVYSLLMGRNYNLDETLSSAQHHIEQNKISCDDKSIVYFFSTGGVLKKQSGRAFLSHCQKNDNHIVSCLDYPYHYWM